MTKAQGCVPGMALALMAGASLAAEPRAGTTFRDCDTCPEMVVLPAGSFVMGTPARAARGAESEATVIRVEEAFALGRFEVTRAQFARFVAETDHDPAPGCRTWDPALMRYADDMRRTWRNPATPAVQRDDHPVSCVSHADAMAYVSWLARKTRKRYRLPSEAEWEYAARAGSSSLRPWGEDAQDSCDQANTYDVTSAGGYNMGWVPAGCRDGHADVAPIGSLGANALGLHDMIGNVAEWVEDCATDSYVGRPRDARAWTWLGGCARRIQRGGSWHSPPDAARSAHRVPALATERGDYVGFRVALDLDERRSRGEDR